MQQYHAVPYLAPLQVSSRIATDDNNHECATTGCILHIVAFQ